MTVELSTRGSVIKTAYEAQANTNAYTDAEQTKVAALSGTNTGDQTIATIPNLQDALDDKQDISGLAAIATTGAAASASYNDIHGIGATDLQAAVDLLADPTDDLTTAQLQNLVNVDTFTGEIYFAAPVDGELAGVPGIYIGVTCTLVSVTHKTTSGTVTVAIKKNGTDLSGLAALAVDSSSTVTNATGTGSDNVLAVGDRIRAVASSASTPVDLDLVFIFTRAVGT